ncbi:hypothetical protein OAI11_00830 [Rhodospirillales bacterium]|nr:hypothetical protein [Rhodospirillales bacterium]
MKRLILASLLAFVLSGEAVASEDEIIQFHCTSNNNGIASNITLAADGSWANINGERVRREIDKLGWWNYMYETAPPEFISWQLKPDNLLLSVRFFLDGKFRENISYCIPFKNPFTD